LVTAERPLPQEVIDEHQRGHGLDHGDGAGEDAGVVSAPAL
jgi:hypothetical protein